MSYYNQIKAFMEKGDDDALQVWMMAQPLTEQLAITQTLKDVVKDMLADVGDEERESILRQVNDFTEEYNNAVLDEHVAAENYQKSIEERDKAMEAMEEATRGVRAYVLECITSNAPNAAEMKELAMKIIESEKENGLYDPENWKGLA